MDIPEIPSLQVKNLILEEKCTKIDSAKGHQLGWVLGNTDCREAWVIVESPIDAISYRTFFEPAAVGLAMGGLQKECVKNLVKWLDPKRVIAAVDNDLGGQQFRKGCAQLFPGAVAEHHIPKNKNWNEDLI